MEYGASGWDRADERFMRVALRLAEKAVGLTSPNPTVGCVLVRDGRIVGQGWHEFAAREHAEVRALRAAGERAKGSVAYVTLEPCSHYGRTPPCAPQLVAAGVRRAVVARTDPNPLVAGRGIRLLEAAGVSVSVGLLQEEAGRLIEPFACHVTTGRPLVVAKAALSLDGRISAGARADAHISCDEALAFGQSLRLQLDAILVGVGTVLADDPELTYRGGQPKARPLHRAILDSRLRTPPTARLLRGAPATPVLVFCGPDAPGSRRRALEKLGAEVIPVPSRAGGLSLRRVLRELGARDLLGVLVEGGSRVHGSFVAQRLIDKFYFLYAPIVLGGAQALPAVGGPGCRRISAAPRFRIARVFRLGEDLALEAYPGYSRSILSPWLPAGVPPCGGRYRERPSRRK